MPGFSPLGPRLGAGLILFIAVTACGPSDQEIAAAAGRLSALYDLREYERGVMEGERWRDAGPRAHAPRAWYVIHVARYSSDDALSDSAVAIAERMAARAPEDPWSWFALAAALNWHRDRGEEALAASDSAVRRSADLPFLRLRADVVRNQESDSAGIALIDSLPEEIQADAIMLVRRGVAEYYLGNATNNDSLRQAALETFARARDTDSTNVEAHFLPGAYVGNQRRVEVALPLLERAAQLTGARDVHQYYWRTVQGRTDISQDEKQAVVRADAEALVEWAGDVPGTLQAVASVYGELGLDEEQAALEERLLAEHPYTQAAEWVLVGRYRDLGTEIWEEKQRTGETDSTKVERRKEMLEAYLARPTHVNKRLLGDAYRELFQLVRDDSTVGGDSIYTLVQGVVEYEGINLSIIYGQTVVALAERQSHLGEARRLAREGLAEAKKEVDERQAAGRFETDGDYQNTYDWYRGMFYDALGWTYFHEGRLDAAQDTLLYAHELDPDNIQNLHHVGQLYERRAQIASDQTAPGAASEADRLLAEAEEYYIKGAMVQRPGENPNDQALEDLYRTRHGGLDGFEAYLASIEDIDRERRRTEILAERIADPEPMPAFALASLRGPQVSSDRLRGKIVVINYWGTWCGPCVVEMPEFQKFHDQYHNDPTVAVLTINNDTNLDDVREWMKKREYDFRVLWDDGYVDRHANVSAWPTTWFIGPDGMIHFEKVGWSESLAEEFSWRVEALRSGGP